MMDPMRAREEPQAIRKAYETHGVRAFYVTRGSAYRNPHERQIRRSLEIAVRSGDLDFTRVLDLAAGSGEATLALRELGAAAIDGIDPFTFEAYQQRTGQPARRETFEQISGGALAGRDYSLIVCSFAMHLVERSRLPQLAMQLSFIADQLLILTPHKRPTIRAEWGWSLESERVAERVRSRLYWSTSRNRSADRLSSHPSLQRAGLTG